MARVFDSIGTNIITLNSLRNYTDFSILLQTQFPLITTASSSQIRLDGPTCVFLPIKHNLKENGIGQDRDDQIVLDLQIWCCGRAGYGDKVILRHRLKVDRQLAQSSDT